MRPSVKLHEFIRKTPTNLRIWLLWLFLLSSATASSQTTRTCGFHQASQQLKDKTISVKPSKSKKPVEGLLLTPVVVHIIHNNGPENISDAIVRSQIDVLNEDFGRFGTGNNSNPLSEDAGIRFCLATIDPDGNPTNGIVRVETANTDLFISDELAVKNLSRWDPNRYLNIWVVRSIDNANTIQGYAYLPSQAAGSNIDGIVINYRFFGRNNTSSPPLYRGGRTMTHEVGHYFELRHPWGGDGPNEGGCNDDDGVSDTPPCDQPFSAIAPACNRPTQCGFPRMIENYMEYSTDECMELFTIGQKHRMRQAISDYRSTLVGYPNLIQTGCQQDFIDSAVVRGLNFSIHPNPAKEKVFIYPLFEQSQSVSVIIHNALGQQVGQVQFPSVTTEVLTIETYDLAAGAYHLTINAGTEARTIKLILTQ